MLKPAADIFKRTVRRGGMEELADDEPVLDPATELREKMCEHGVLLRECADPACQERWLAVWREFSRGFEGFQPVLPRFPRPPAPALEPAEAETGEAKNNTAYSKAREALKIETRLRDDMFESVMGECVI